jgi:hypothetical protein
MTFGTPNQEFLDRLETRRDALRDQAKTFLETRKAQGVEQLNDIDSVKFRATASDINDLTDQCDHYRSGMARVGTYPAGLGGSDGAVAHAKRWSEQVADKFTRAMGRDGESRAVVSGSLDIPALIEPGIIPISRPTRLIDLLVNRRVAAGQSVEYFVQTVRIGLHRRAGHRSHAGNRPLVGSNSAAHLG